jgi:hypothetical protein
MRDGAIAHNDLRDPEGSRLVIKLHNEGESIDAVNMAYTEDVAIYDNHFVASGSRTSWSMEIGPQNNTTDESIRRIVYERNFLTQNGANGYPAVEVSADDVMLRNNVVRITTSLDNATCYEAKGRKGIESPFPHFNVEALYNTCSVAENETNPHVGTSIFCNGGGCLSRGTLMHGFTGDIHEDGGVDDANGLLDTTSAAALFVDSAVDSFLDFRLNAATSPINAGGTTLLKGLAKDGALATRQVGGTYDVGAFERQ